MALSAQELCKFFRRRYRRGSSAARLSKPFLPSCQMLGRGEAAVQQHFLRVPSSALLRLRKKPRQRSSAISGISAKKMLAANSSEQQAKETMQHNIQTLFFIFSF
jgi:hypothetical protein